MARIFISGSSTGLGLIAGQMLAGGGHNVVLHARNASRAADARRELSNAEGIVIGDLSTSEGTRLTHNASAVRAPEGGRSRIMRPLAEAR
jgi:short-subunit dehydrogenase